MVASDKPEKAPFPLIFPRLPQLLDLARFALIVGSRQGQGMFRFICAFMVLPSLEISADISAAIFMPDAVRDDLAISWRGFLFETLPFIPIVPEGTATVPGQIKPPVLMLMPGRMVTDPATQLPFWVKFRVIGALVSPSPLATPVKLPWKSPASLDATCALHMVRRQAATDRDSRIILRIS